MIAYDIALDEDGDLLIENGDFAIKPSDKQHVSDIINSNPGEWKQFPLLGVGLIKYLNSTGKNDQLSRIILLQLQADGYSNVAIDLESLDINDIKIQINATRV